MPYQTVVKDYNERRVLTLLRLGGPLSRTEIARRVGLPKSTISEMMERLMARDMVFETTIQTKNLGAGRPGIRVALNPQSALFLGVEVGVHALRFALVDLGLHVVHTQTFPLPHPPSPQYVLEETLAFIERTEDDPEYRERLRGVGVCVPGLVRSDGHVVNLPTVNWQDINFLELAEKVLGTDLAVTINNDANAAALGQVYRSPVLADQVFLSLRIHEGCGGAAILNGRLLSGGHGLASEFGHIRVGDAGPLCACGRRGCLEPHINLDALAAALPDAAPVPSEVAARARAGDERALAAARQLTRHLQVGLISLTNIFNPSEIVLGGAMAHVYEVTLGELSRGVAQGIVPGMPAPRLLVNPLGDYECAVGAAATVHQHTFGTAGISENLGR